MLDINEIAKGLSANVQTLVDKLGECNINAVKGEQDTESNRIFFTVTNPIDISKLIAVMIQVNETDSSSLTSRVLALSDEDEKNWGYSIDILSDFNDEDRPEDRIGFGVGVVISIPMDDYTPVLARLTQVLDALAEPEDESCKVAGFCKGCFIVDLERLIEIDEFAILNQETGESLSGSDIESVELNGEVVQISLAK